MQPRDERRETEQPLSKVSWDGSIDSLRQMQRERLERAERDAVRELSRERIPTPQMSPFKPRESPYRFYIGAIGLGIAVGISWTLTLTDTSFARHLSHAHALEILWGFVAAALVYQTIYLTTEGRRMKREYDELKRIYDRL